MVPIQNTFSSTALETEVYRERRYLSSGPDNEPSDGEYGSWTQTVWTPGLRLPLWGCVTVGKVLNLPVLQFLHL